MQTIEFHAIEFHSAGEALQYADASGRGRAILCAGRFLVAEDHEIERIESAGVEFALLFDHELPDGGLRIMTVPVN